jgi:transposase
LHLSESNLDQLGRLFVEIGISNPSRRCYEHHRSSLDGRWRDLPERLGDYRSVTRRYYRWIERGVLDEMLPVLAREADLEWLMIDSTIVRAHQHAAGARKTKGGADAQGLGWSRGGLSTKIHAATEALGLPVRLIATPGQRIVATA